VRMSKSECFVVFVTEFVIKIAHGLMIKLEVLSCPLISLVDLVARTYYDILITSLLRNGS
jgi:hypothetical protein